MKKYGYVLLFVVFVAGSLYGQSVSIDAEVEKARVQQMNERLRGKSVVASEQTGVQVGNKTFNFEEIRKKTIEMNELLQSVNGDVVQVSKGVVSADLGKKLKRIEKLAREIRRDFE
jgi:hypothetical protein